MRYAAVLTVINALVDFVARSRSASPAGGGRAGLVKLWALLFRSTTSIGGD
ncbi:hypothetical protein ACLB1M_19335 [Escherichia coli]